MIFFIGLGPKFLDSGSQPFMKFAYEFDVRSSFKTHFRKNFYPTPKNFVGKKPQISPTCCQSEVRNFEMAQRIDIQQIRPSYVLNMLKSGTKLRASPHGFLCYLGRKLVNYK